MKSYDDLITVINKAKEDVEKAEKGNHSAGVRVRKAMQDAKNLAQAIRKEISALAKS